MICNGAIRTAPASWPISCKGRPRRALLLVVSYRSEDAGGPCLRALNEALGKSDSCDRRDLPVAALSESEVCELVHLLLGQAASGRRGSPASRAAIRSSSPSWCSTPEQEAWCRSRPRWAAWFRLESRPCRTPPVAFWKSSLSRVSRWRRPMRAGAAGLGADERTMVARLASARFVRGVGSSDKAY